MALTLSDLEMALRAYGGHADAFGKYKEDRRVVWVDTRITVSIRRTGKRQAEVSSTVDTYVDNRSYGEPSSEEEFNRALMDSLCSWFPEDGD